MMTYMPTNEALYIQFFLFSRQEIYPTACHRDVPHAVMPHPTSRVFSTLETSIPYSPFRVLHSSTIHSLAFILDAHS